MKGRYNPETVILDEEEQWFEDHTEEFVSGKTEERDALIRATRDTLTESETKTERMDIRMA